MFTNTSYKVVNGNFGFRRRLVVVVVGVALDAVDDVDADATKSKK